MPTVDESPRGRKRLALVGHCILNQNARAPGIAVHRGVIAPLLQMLQGAGYELLQLPCPETAFTGVSRWWFVYEQYDSVNYRRHCAKIARAVSKLVKPYSEEGYDIVLLGLGMSPSCGVRMRQTNKQWRGRPFDVGDVASVEAGSGVWIQELERTLKREGIGYRILDVPPVLIYPPDRVPASAIYPQSEEAAWVELKRFLEA
jgi:predicted secreted protein